MGIDAARSHATAQDWLGLPDLESLVRIAASRLRIPQRDIADLVQETRLALYALAPTTHVGSSWIRHMIRNKAIDLLRSQMRTRSREREFSRRTVRATRDAEPVLLLRSRVSAMPRSLQVLYALHYVAGCSEREIAAHLGVSRASVRRLDHRLRTVLLGA